MKIPGPSDPAGDSERPEIGGAPPRVRLRIPLLLTSEPGDSLLVARLKSAWLPDRAWYVVAVALAKYIEATRGRRQTTELDRLHAIIAQLRLDLGQLPLESLSRRLYQAYGELSASPVLRRGRRARTLLTPEALRRFVAAARTAIRDERGQPHGRRAARDRLTHLVAGLGARGATDEEELRLAREWAQAMVSRLPDEQVTDILAPGHPIADAANALASAITGYTEKTIGRKQQRRRSPRPNK